MLTEDQIKNLKPGDSLVMRGTYIKQYSNGDIVIKCSITSGGELTPDIKHFHPTCVSIPSKDLKYDPYRLFKKGDIVEMDTHGRDIAASMKKSGVELGKRYTVTEDENNTGYVSFIGDDGIEHHSMFFWLKLVTPVEELEPFYVERQGEKSGGFCYTVRKYEGWVESTFYFGECRSRDEQQAKAAAEAERDRLNAEYRKKIS